MNRKQVYSVSSVNQYIKSLFMDDFALNHIYVRGEVSNCKYHSSGHIYFTLKDRGGAIACVMFAGNRKGLNFRMSEGMAVIVYGSVSVYERDGKYQLYAREIIQEGAGRLYEAYEALKKKLLAEGLFDEEHKQKIPKYPKRLGVVTARTGAAVQDIINVSLRRNPWLQIVFCPAAVQGDGAAQSVVRGIHALEAAGVDVMIGYRADDSYFSFAEDFVSNTISLRDLNMAMQLGTLGEQIVLLSKRSFGHIEFTGYEVADYREYYYKRFERDQKARADYARRKKTLQQLTEDIFILDIIREGMDNDDPRLRLQLSL